MTFLGFDENAARTGLRWLRVLSVCSLLLVGCKDKKDEDGPGEAPDCTRRIDTSSYDYDANIPWSLNPPGGLRPSEVPQFVALGWDDNGFVESFDWCVDMFAERDLATTFFLTTTYISDGATSGNPQPLRASWNGAYEAGHEMGNHTQYHTDGTLFDSDEWSVALDTAFEWMTLPFAGSDSSVDRPGAGIDRDHIYGFRSPFLHYNDVLFEELKQRGVWYDCSIEEGYQLSLSAKIFPWPYTLDNGSPGHDYQEKRNVEARQFPLGSHAGLIELPAYVLVIPPDTVSKQYGFEPGLLERIREHSPPIEEGSDRITGLDYNLWWESELSRAEALAILKYNLDERLRGNRAPFLFGAHTDFYRENWDSVETFEERRAAIEDFLDYARGIDAVRIVTFKEVADYMREPRHIDCFSDDEQGGVDSRGGSGSGN